MLKADSRTPHTSPVLDSRLAPANTNINSSLSDRLKNTVMGLYNKVHNNDSGFVILTGLGGIAAVVYGFWGTDFAILSAENGMREVAVPLIVRTAYNIDYWMAFNAALILAGVTSSGEGTKRLGRLAAERDFCRDKNKTLEECLATGNNDTSKQELQAILCKESEIYAAEQLKKLDANPQSYWSRIKSRFSEIGLATYAVAQGGIVATFMLVNSGYNIDGGLIWNDLLFGAASGIMMYTAGKYYEGKTAFYRGLQTLKSKIVAPPKGFGPSTPSLEG